MLSYSDIGAAISSGSFRIECELAPIVRGSSVCLRLANEFSILHATSTVDLRAPESYPDAELVRVEPDGHFDLQPGAMVLGHTMERISLSRSHAGMISGLSGLARLGLMVQLSSLVSPGFGENAPSSLTLELFNFLRVPIRLYHGMRVCHFCLFTLSNPSEHGYDDDVGTYSGQSGPIPSRFFSDFEDG